MSTDHTSNSLEQILEAAQQMRPLNPTLVRLSSLLLDPMVSLQDLASVISYDQALVLNLLKAANSSLTRRNTQITSVQEAVSYLGGYRTFNLLMACTMAEDFSQVTLEGYRMEEGVLWRDSVISSLVAEHSPKVFRNRAPKETSISALLLNVGKVVMSPFINPDVRDHIELMLKQGMEQHEAEKWILNIHYAELSGIIAEEWGLPKELVTPIKFQATPHVVQQTSCDVTHVCQAFVTQMRHEQDDFQIHLEQGVLERLQPTVKNWEEVLLELVKTSYTHMSHHFGVTVKDLPNCFLDRHEQLDTIQGGIHSTLH